MGRAKGTPKTGGRKLGTPNKVTSSVKEWLSRLIDKNRKQIERDLKQLEPKERLQVIEKLMQYVIPKQQAVSADVSMEKLSNEQLDSLIEELTKGVDNGDTDR